MSTHQATTFRVGDRVSWSSQVQATETTKRGVVVAVVPAGMRPHDVDDEAKRIYERRGRSIPFGFALDHESYFIHVPSKSGKGRGRFYWPIVKHLEPVGA